MTDELNPGVRIHVSERSSPSNGGWTGDIRAAALYGELEAHCSVHQNNTDGPVIGGMAAINDDLLKAKAEIVTHVKRNWPLHSVTESSLTWLEADGFVSGSMPYEPKSCDYCGKDEIKCRASRLSCCPECFCRPNHSNTDEEPF